MTRDSLKLDSLKLVSPPAEKGFSEIGWLMQPLPVHQRVLQFDQWVMLGTSLLLLLFLYTGSRLSRLEGGVLLVGYGLYVGLSFATFRG